MKNITLKKALLFSYVLLILIPILLISACNENGDNVAQTTTQAPEPARLVTVEELSREIGYNALPPLEKSTQKPNDDPLAGGTARLENLSRAPQDLVGEKIQLSFADIRKNLIVFRYNANTKQLVIMNDNAGLWYHPSAMMLVMQTEYVDMRAFLSQTDSWTGTVTAVNIVGTYEVLRASASFLHNGSIKATESSTVCYGKISSEGIFTYDSMQSRESFAEPFERSLARFGIE